MHTYLVGGEGLTSHACAPVLHSTSVRLLMTVVTWGPRMVNSLVKRVMWMWYVFKCPCYSRARVFLKWEE